MWNKNNASLFALQTWKLPLFINLQVKVTVMVITPVASDEAADIVNAIVDAGPTVCSMLFVENTL